MKDKPGVKRASTICRLILKKGKNWKKGKQALKLHLCKKLRISLTQLDIYICATHAVVSDEPTLEPETREYALYTTLSSDNKFKNLAKRAMELYDSLERLYLAYSICNNILEHGPGWKKGKEALKAKIAKKLNISLTTVTAYIKTIHAAIGEGEVAATKHIHGEHTIYTILNNDHVFKNLAKKAIKEYDQLMLVKTARAVSTAYAVCNLILEDGPKWNKGKKAMKAHIVKKLKITATPTEQYIKTIRAVATGKGEPAKMHNLGEQNLYTALCADKEFKEISKKAIQQYEKLNKGVWIAYEICRRILEYGPGWKRSKLAMREKIAKNLNISPVTVEDYIQTTRAVLGKSKPSLGHSVAEHNLYSKLCEDSEFKKLAKEAIEIYTNFAEVVNELFCPKCGGLLIKPSVEQKSHKCSRCGRRVTVKL
jgi:hypothetical protein